MCRLIANKINVKCNPSTYTNYCKHIDIHVLLMTLDLIGCQVLNSPIRLLDVVGSLSTQQVLSGLIFGH